MNKIYTEIEKIHGNILDLVFQFLCYIPILIITFPGIDCKDEWHWYVWVIILYLSIIVSCIMCTTSMYRGIILKLTERCDELLDEINTLKENKNEIHRNC